MADLLCLPCKMPSLSSTPSKENPTSGSWCSLKERIWVTTWTPSALLKLPCRQLVTPWELPTPLPCRLGKEETWLPWRPSSCLKLPWGDTLPVQAGSQNIALGKIWPAPNLPVVKTRYPLGAGEGPAPKPRWGSSTLEASLSHTRPAQSRRLCPFPPQRPGSVPSNTPMPALPRE